PSQGCNVGGLETFAWRLAQGLARDSMDSVQFVVRTQRKRPVFESNSIHIYPFHEPLREIRRSVSEAMELDPESRRPRIKKWRASLGWQIPILALRKAFWPAFSEEAAIEKLITSFAPDMILTLGVNKTSATLGDIASRLSVPILLWLQSNADLEAKLLDDPSFVDRYGVQSQHAKDCWRSNRNIICQTVTQRELLTALIDRDLSGTVKPSRVTVIPNPIDTERFCASDSFFTQRNGVLWIGRSDRFHKRPLLALQIAKLCPNLPFTMILNQGDPDVLDEVLQTKGPNVTVIDYLPSSEMPRVMKASRLFLSTGAREFEGFPNVLIEASACGTPIVSLEDFDGYLSRSRAGRCAENQIEIASQLVRDLHSSENEWKTLSGNGIENVEKHHRLETVVASFRQLAISALQ
ncbi:MAG: glycosyltransferase family 4 protein, partial [Pirellula sp.]